MIPERAERRRNANGEPLTRDRRRVRNENEYRVPLGDKWIHGWLAFETQGEKRRLAPIPEAWDQLDEDALREMCDRATPIRPSRRLAD